MGNLSGSVKYGVVWEENPESDEELCWLVPLETAKESFLLCVFSSSMIGSAYFKKNPWKSLRTCLEERYK